MSPAGLLLVVQNIFLSSAASDRICYAGGLLLRGGAPSAAKMFAPARVGGMLSVTRRARERRDRPTYTQMKVDWPLPEVRPILRLTQECAVLINRSSGVSTAPPPTMDKHAALNAGCIQNSSGSVESRPGFGRNRSARIGQSCAKVRDTSGQLVVPRCKLGRNRARSLYIGPVKLARTARNPDIWLSRTSLANLCLRTEHVRGPRSGTGVRQHSTGVKRRISASPCRRAKHTQLSKCKNDFRQKLARAWVTRKHSGRMAHHRRTEAEASAPARESLHMRHRVKSHHVPH